jgi:glycosyltransferase involved in cell wall biosynthesis
MNDRSNNQARIAISWSRLPPYAARLIRSGVQSLDEPVQIIASKPPFLTDEVEQLIDRPIIWIDPNETCSWSDLGIQPPEIFFQAGWLSKAFKNLGKEVRQHGGRIVCFSDNSWKNTPRQWLGAIAFRMSHRQCFDAVWVPGYSGFQLIRFFGMPENRIYQGMYGADPEVFSPGISLAAREKKFVFVGQLIERKGVDLLVKVFSQFHKRYPDWQLHVIGSGPLSHLFDAPGITVEGFQPPDRVASILRGSRFLILPSYEEHWGLVVHEAALSGCGLIVSKAVGASFDLVSEGNGSVFDANSCRSLYQSLEKAASLGEAELNSIFSQSQEKASKFSPRTWAETFKKIVTDFRENDRFQLVRS